MSLSPELRALAVDLPACPRTLLQLLPLLDDEYASLGAMAAVVEADMALASAVVRTVNSAMFGLLRRVDTVGEAMRHLGSREVAALTYASALRSAFAPTPQLDRLWDQAAWAGLLMGRSAAALGLDPWRAHTAGLFARSGQAVLLARSAASYAPLLARAGADQVALLAAEQAEFGLTHAVYGSALCAAWGLSNEVVKFVRERVAAPASWRVWPAPLRSLLLLGHLADALIAGSDLAPLAETVAPDSGWSSTQLQQALAGPWQQLNATRRTPRAPA
jgi:HD-like signal output (HDOD) protein